MDMKHPPALQDEPHLVFGVRVFLAEFGEHRVEVGRVGPHVNHVGGHKPAAAFQFVDLGRVSSEDLLGRGAGIDPIFQRPDLVVEPLAGQKLSDLRDLGDAPPEGGNRDDGHGENLLLE